MIRLDECRRCPRIAIVFPIYRRAAFGGLFPYIVREFLDPRRFSIDLYFSDHRKNGLWVGYYSGRPLAKNDYILFSLSYELDYYTMVRALIENGIEPYRDRRRGTPIIIVGGPAVTGNPRPLDYIVDVAVVGEAEPFLAGLQEHADAGSGGYKSFIEEISGVPGAYIPELGNRVERAWIRDLDRLHHPIYQYESSSRDLVYGYGLRVEATRGCYRSCSFCMEGHIFVPFRFRRSGTLIDIIEKGTSIAGVDRVVFFSLSLFDSPEIDRVLEWLVSNNYKASIPSVRLETLNDDRLELIAMLGQKTLTIAPETASESIGCLIRKPYSIESVVDVASKSLRIGIQTVKLYYIIGFPGEDDGDVEGIAKTANRIVESYRGRPRRKIVHLSINPLIPKPQTPMQWLGLMSEDEYRRKIRLLRGSLLRGSIEIDFLDYRVAYVTAAIGLGDSEIGRVIVEWATNGDGFLAGFLKAANDLGIDLSYVSSGRELGSELPWSVIRDSRMGYFEGEYRSKFL